MHHSQKVRQFTIKKNGKERSILEPIGQYKHMLRVLNFFLEKEVAQRDHRELIHGFMVGRSPVTNAARHVRKQYTLSVDIQDFFPSVRLAHVAHLPYKLFKDVNTLNCFRHDCLPQGFPTSPSLANYAMLNADDIIYRNLPADCVYTRYADDLTVSFNCKHRDRVFDIINSTLIKFGFRIKLSKTRFQNAKYGRREITGVMVDDEVHPSRDLRRKIAHYQHKLKEVPRLIYKVRGLESYYTFLENS